MRHAFLTTISFALFFIATTTHANDTFHRWVDDNGVTHYSKTKPADRDSVPVHADSNTTISGGAPSDSNHSSNDNANTEGTDAESTIAQWCAHHRDTLEVLTSSSRVHQTDPQTGEKTIISEPERARLIEETKTLLKDCPE